MPQFVGRFSRWFAPLFASVLLLALGVAAIQISYRAHVRLVEAQTRATLASTVSLLGLWQQQQLPSLGLLAMLFRGTGGPRAQGYSATWVVAANRRAGCRRLYLSFCEG